MHGLAALIEIQVEHNVSVTLEIRRGKRDIHYRHVKLVATRAVTSSVARNSADWDCSRIIGWRYRNELLKRGQIRCRNPRESLQGCEPGGTRSRNVTRRRSLAQANLLKLEEEEESILTAPVISGIAIRSETWKVKWTTDVAAITVLIEARIRRPRIARQLLQIIEAIQFLVAEKFECRSVKVIAA